MPLVAIVGRPNVGKSTLFNRLTESRHSIVHDEPGITRDRIYGTVHWSGMEFSIVDTGGFVPNTTDRFEEGIREQVHIAIDEAEIVLFVVDVSTGVTDLDDEMARILRLTDKPVFVLANKADNDERRWESGVFFQLGLGDVYAVSSINGSGTGELLDAVTEVLPKKQDEKTEDDRLRIAIIGRPNVGKSSLTNALVGTERSLVTEIGGTTRDAIDSVIRYHGREIVLVDTAGLRKRSRVVENVEFYSMLRTHRAIDSCTIAVLLIDAREGLQVQDIRVLKQAEEMNKGLIIAVNKWDLLDKETNTARDYQKQIFDRLQTLNYIPALFISATTRQRINRVLEKAIEVDQQYRRRIPTHRVNEVMLKVISRHHPPTYRNQYVKIKYVTQIQETPPVFAFFCNHPQGIQESYQRYLKNKLREHFGFEGVPLRMVFKSK